MIDRIWEEISYSKLKHNLDIIKKYAKSKSIICMVKDNAYGHGAVNISKFLSEIKVTNKSDGGNYCHKSDTL